MPALFFVGLLGGIVLGVALAVRENKFYPSRLAAGVLVGLVAGSVLSCLRIIPVSGLMLFYAEISIKS